MDFETMLKLQEYILNMSPEDKELFNAIFLENKDEYEKNPVEGFSKCLDKYIIYKSRMDLTEHFLEERKNAIFKLFSDDSFMNWAVLYCKGKKNPVFDGKRALMYRDKNLVKFDKENLGKLSLLFDGISEYALKHNYNYYSDDSGKCWYYIKFNGFYLSVSTYPNIADDISIDLMENFAAKEFIEFDYIRTYFTKNKNNNYSLENAHNANARYREPDREDDDGSFGNFLIR